MTHDYTSLSLTVPADESVEFPPDLLALHLVATGILRYYEQITKGTFLKEDYPHSLELGLNRLDAMLYQHGVPLLRSVPALLAQCQLPFESWPPVFPSIEFSSDARLLAGPLPTPLCENLACSASNVEAELSERRFMERVFVLCKDANPEYYTEFRRFLIRNPVLTAADFLEAQEMLSCAETLKDPLQAAYEAAPLEYVYQGHFLCCPQCGNLMLPLVPGQFPVCEEERCRKIPYSSRHAKHPHALPARQQVYWLRRDLRRFVMMPGRAELRLEEKLLAMGVQVEMWPEFDRVDLLLHLPLPKTFCIAVDVKDWASPFLLARKVKRKSFPTTTPSWNMAYYVFPQERRHDQPRYVDIFQAVCNTQPSHLTIGKAVKAAFEQQFLFTVRTLLKKGGTHAN